VLVARRVPTELVRCGLDDVDSSVLWQDSSPMPMQWFEVVPFLSSLMGLDRLQELMKKIQAGMQEGSPSKRARST